MPYTGPEPTPFQINRQLMRMLETSAFTRRERQAALFKTMVELALTEGDVTEKRLLEILYPHNQFDNPVVRVLATKLPNALSEYYSGAGINDLVRIHLPGWAVSKKERQPAGKNYKPAFSYNYEHDLTIRYLTAWKKMCGPDLARIEEAVQTFWEITTQDPDFADAWLAFADGCCLLAIVSPADRDASLRAAENCIAAGWKLAPNTWHAHATSAFLSLLKGQFDEATRAFNLAIKINRTMAEGHPAYLFFYVVANRSDAANLTESRALELSWNPELQAVHGRMLEWSERPDEAERYYRRAIDLDPNSGLCHWGLARLLAKAGKDKEAAKHLERAELLLGAKSLKMWMEFEEFANKPHYNPTEPDPSSAPE